MKAGGKSFYVEILSNLIIKGTGMLVRIHYEIDGSTDYFDVIGKYIKDIQKQAILEVEKRGLTREKNNYYSEVLEDGIIKNDQ